MGQLIYALASIAFRYQNGVTALDGVRRLTETVHPHGVPVTWLVSPGSARGMSATLTEWHDRFGHDVVVALVCLRNYERPWNANEYYAKPLIPQPKLIRDPRFPWRRENEISVTSHSAMPYGMALWNDYSLYQLGAATTRNESKVLPHELLFLRYQLKHGETRFIIELVGK